ncbi:hypothetical protein SAMN05216203_0659 [Marinobacter daqiaonensis]|uniref:Uncharacterized protein n=1 Tax=Marinobacter daqiaonensis TaxID=650891 RepID=A0A1I6H0B1_9GAMM|nr:hypothetical protein [Marinobacter daqiaonensis]SFR47787.1 hypothetical protein SAMN05216203_0659 [Marinobacter daqiaonensis]
MSSKNPIYMFFEAPVSAGKSTLAGLPAATRNELFKDGCGVSADETVQAPTYLVPGFAFNSVKRVDKHGGTTLTAPINLAWRVGEGISEQLASFMESEYRLATAATALIRRLRPATS